MEKDVGIRLSGIKNCGLSKLRETGAILTINENMEVMKWVLQNPVKVK